MVTSWDEWYDVTAILYHGFELEEGEVWIKSAMILSW
jgi:hypothetical protein